MNTAIKQSSDLDRRECWAGRNGFLGALFLAFALFSWAGLAAQPQEVLGLKLAYPQSEPAMSESDSLFRCSEDEYYRLQLSVDASGMLTGITADDVITGTRTDEFRKYFAKIRFQPGQRNGKSVSQSLPVTVYLFTDERSPVVDFPVGVGGRINEPSLYWQALELNGVTLPHLTRFPSYHSTLSGSDTASGLRYVLASVQLNRKGVPTDIKLSHTNYRTFASQILTAVNWARYVPAAIDSHAVASSGFILVSFFPSIQYPTRPLKISNLDTTLTLERTAVRFLPDTLGILSGPIPHYVKNWSYPLAAARNAWRRIGIFRYEVDKSGFATLVSGGNGSEAADQFGHSLAASMRFYPAIDNRGNSVSFEGAVKVTPDSASNVRVRFLWLQ